MVSKRVIARYIANLINVHTLSILSEILRNTNFSTFCAYASFKKAKFNKFGHLSRVNFHRALLKVLLLKLLQQREKITLRWKSISPTTSSLFHLLRVLYVCTQIQLVHRQKQTVSRPYPTYDLSSMSSPWHVSEAPETPETPRRSVNALWQTVINILLFSLENYQCVDVKLSPRGKRISCNFWLPRRNVKSKELRRSVCLEIYWANLPNKYTAAACRSNANVNFVFTAKHNVR